mmetsp:Transcript_38470/g.92708  ORF Transcript_38470/g.92708 Transcript_38470/m.92708 type:complete len:216 (+) Transcript_38470:1085-1732(+)
MIHHLPCPIQDIQRSTSRIVTCQCCGRVRCKDAIDNLGAGPASNGCVEGKLTKVRFSHGGFGVGREKRVDNKGGWLASACLMQWQPPPNTPRKHCIFRPRADNPDPRFRWLFFHPITNVLPLGILHKHEQFRRPLFVLHFPLLHDPRRRRRPYDRCSCTGGYEWLMIGNPLCGGRPMRTSGCGIVPSARRRGDLVVAAVMTGFVVRRRRSHPAAV